MGLSGTWSEANLPYSLQHPSIKMHQIVFTLKNTNFFGSETIDLAVCDSYGENPWLMSGRSISRGGSIVINNAGGNGWAWHQYDFVAAFKNGRLINRWICDKPLYKPGKCPSCHGTTICSHCHGNHIGEYRYGAFQECPYCRSGKCSTCDIDYRTRNNAYSSLLADQSAPYAMTANTLLSQLAQIDAEIAKINWTIESSMPKESLFGFNRPDPKDRALSPLMHNRYKLEVEKRKIHLMLIDKAFIPAIQACF